MKKGIKTIFDFFDSTTIHGLAYLTNDKSKITRFIWLLIVVIAFSFAGFFLSETLAGYNTKFTSTTIETRNVDQFPFPAVTFYPGDENLKKGFYRTFLNQIKLTRYKGEMWDNEEFFQLFEWLLGPIGDQLFRGVEDFLIEEQNWIKSNTYDEQVCELMALETLKQISMKEEIRAIYIYNLFKYKTYSDVNSLITNEIAPAIKRKVEESNLTEYEIFSSCNENDPMMFPQNEQMKDEIKSLIYSYSWLFSLEGETEIGAGDLLVSKLEIGFSPKKALRGVLFEFHLKFWNTASICIPARSLL